MPPAFFFNIFKSPKGSGISVWGTIQLLQPNTPTYVVSSYSIDGGNETIFNATEQTGYQFQQKLFQSATLNDSVPHTIVVTLVNNGTFFIDYFLIVPAGGAISTSASSSVSTAGSSTTTGAGARPHQILVPLGPVIGGTLCGFALIVIAILAFFLCRRRRRDKKNRIRESNFLLFNCVVELALNFFMYHQQ